ncbi:conserved hypothetical protein [Sulfurihydrogenibium azorense Az-Fu1]|uniref:DUF4351 domain-containing protein n=2 Tax=Sulfurihydrogenibium azorense TaxID=309806 RepID=C1DWY5_SULAA|nr:hypothetical protein [Sulfurihydrogenibium azorense]ACN98286.1 conserved hypothetical protein [Sulfurihydrogenibium azorense Az-Fu1]MDM7274046.1 hypothetical protein [Sulfurihydrogenibium azorense]
MPITIEWTWEELESYPGIGKALKTGKEKFIKEGLQQGLQQGLKDSILEILELKFGVLPEDVKAKINSTDDIEVLKEMRKKAILIQSLDEF